MNGCGERDEGRIGRGEIGGSKMNKIGEDGMGDSKMGRAWMDKNGVGETWQFPLN